jgi:uncharacterized protein (TIRG00374 family)
MLVLNTARGIGLQRAVGIEGGGFGRCLLAYFAGMYAGLVTPGRVGELIRVRYLTGNGAGFGPSMATVLWDRIIDIAGLLFIGLLALLPISGRYKFLYIGAVVLVLLLAAAVLGIAIGRGAFRRSLEGFLRRMPGKSRLVGRRAGDVLLSFTGTLDRTSWKSLSGMFAITLCGWVFYYVQSILLARSVGIPLSILPLVVSTTAAAITSLIPISISGIGTRDATLVVLFDYFGRPSEEAVALSGLVLMVMVANALVGFLAGQILESRPFVRRAPPEAPRG